MKLGPFSGSQREPAANREEMRSVPSLGVTFLGPPPAHSSRDERVFLFLIVCVWTFFLTRLLGISTLPLGNILLPAQ